MKKIIFGLALAAMTFSACNGNTAKSADTTQSTADTPTAASPQSAADTTVKPSGTGFPSKQIIAAYLQLKNALTQDNGKDAATAAGALVTTLSKADMKSLPQAQMKAYMDIADDLKENAEHISENAGKIDHQREHFIPLSEDMADFIKAFGNGGQTLYRDFCPMADNGKGAIWISEQQAIKNPYLGKAMPTCGTVKETIR